MPAADAYADHARQPENGARRRPREPREPPPHQRRRRDTDDSLGSASRGANANGQTVPRQPRVRFPPPLNAPLLSKVATMSGFLRKQADNEPGKWTQYYFVLKPTTYLYYYNTKEDAEPRGIIDMEFLRDVRLNAECVERSVGGSPNGFRVTGKLPRNLCPPGKDPNKTQFRPVHLDAESRDVADAWMEALKAHRFDLARHRDYDDLVDSMEEVDERLLKLTTHANELAAASHQMLRQGTELVCKLRGVELDDDAGRPRGMSHLETDTTETLAAIAALFDEMFAEADRHRRLVEIMRQREDEHFEREAHLKGCDADLKVQTKRCEQLESDVERLLEERRVLQQEFEARSAELVARERQVQAQEKAANQQIKQREQELEKKLQEVNQKSSKWTKELEKEAERRNQELEKRRKALEKQQKSLEQKQKVLEKRLQETAPPKMRFVGAIGRSKAAAAPAREETVSKHQQPEEEHEDELSETEPQAAAVAAASKSKGRFGFLTKKTGNPGKVLEQVESNEDETEVEHQEPFHEPRPVNTEEHYLKPAGRLPPLSRTRRPTVDRQSEDESDYFDSQSKIDIRPFLAPLPPPPQTHHLADRSSTASTARLSGLSYSSSDSSLGTGGRYGRSLTTGAIQPPRQTPPSSRSASVSAVTSVYAGMTVRLPPEWSYKESKSYRGRFFYYNRITKETRWEFPFEAVIDEDQGAFHGHSTRDSNRLSRRSSFDDGDDFLSSQDEDEAVRASYRNRSMTHGGGSAMYGGGSSLIRRRQKDAMELSRWQSQQKMNYVAEEPSQDDGMNDVETDEDDTPATGKKTMWNKKFPQLRAKSKPSALDEAIIDEEDGKGFADTAAYRAARAKTQPALDHHTDDSDSASTAKASKTWKGKFIPKVPFKKSKPTATTPPPQSPHAEHVHGEDSTRCEF